LRAALLASLDAELVQGDLQSPRSLKRAVQGIDTVIHLAARAIFEEYDLVRPTIVDGSVSLMRAAASAGIKTFVYASSLLVYASQKDPIDQDTPTRPTIGYGRAKLEAEEVLSKIAADAGIGLASIRLPHVYGARDLMFRQVQKGKVVFPGNGKNVFAHMHVEDAARLLISVAENCWTGAIPVADNVPTSWSEYFAEIRKYYPRFRTFGVPRWIALLGTQLLAPLRRLRRLPSLYTPGAVRSWNLNLPVKDGLLWGELAIRPNYPTIYQGIPAVLDECLEFRWVHPIEDRHG
jgi:nucleoside-diphosphate-sugar epimerase